MSSDSVTYQLKINMFDIFSKVGSLYFLCFRSLYLSDCLFKTNFKFKYYKNMD